MQYILVTYNYCSSPALSCNDCDNAFKSKLHYSCLAIVCFKRGDYNSLTKEIIILIGHVIRVSFAKLLKNPFVLTKLMIRKKSTTSIFLLRLFSQLRGAAAVRGTGSYDTGHVRPEYVRPEDRPGAAAVQTGQS